MNDESLEYSTMTDQEYDQFLDDILGENSDDNNKMNVVATVDLSTLIDIDLPF